jgi:hypothetical protein
LRLACSSGASSPSSPSSKRWLSALASRVRRPYAPLLLAIQRLSHGCHAFSHRPGSRQQHHQGPLCRIARSAPRTRHHRRRERRKRRPRRALHLPATLYSPLEEPPQHPYARRRHRQVVLRHLGLPDPSQLRRGSSHRLVRLTPCQSPSQALADPFRPADPLCFSVARKCLKYAKLHQLIDHDNFLVRLSALVCFGHALRPDFLALRSTGLRCRSHFLHSRRRWTSRRRRPARVLHRRQRGQLGRLLPLRDGGRGFPGACALASLPYSPELTLAIASPQDVIDTLLNQAVFIYLGAILPWDALSNAEWNRKALLSTLWHSDTQLITAIAFAVTPWRFVVLGILILLFRRLPFVVGLTKAIPVFATWRESAFSGCVIRFGRFVISVLTCGPCLRCFADGLALSVRNPRLRPPLAPLADAALFFAASVGVSAVYYIETALRVLPDDEAHARLRNTIGPVCVPFFCGLKLSIFSQTIGRLLRYLLERRGQSPATACTRPCR